MSVDEMILWSEECNKLEVDGDPFRTFTSPFMENHTEFDSIETLLERSPLQYESPGASVGAREMDEFVQQHTDFSAWHDLREAALENWWGQDPRDRRTYRRYQLSKDDVTVKMGTGDTVASILRDVSVNGLRVESQHSTASGNPFDGSNLLEVVVPIEFANREPSRRILHLKTTVCWTTNDPPYQAGLEIIRKEVEEQI